jgi:cysteine desulfurase
VSAPEPAFCDHNAGSPALPEVLAAFVDTERRCPGNPASTHTAGRAARAALEHARERIANALGVAAADVVFTSGGTEAANLAVLGLGAPEQPVLLAPTEHPAVAEPAALRGTVDWRVEPDGTAIVARPERMVGLVCLAHAQSELGTLQPIAAAAAMAATLAVPLFVDAAQTLGRVDLQPVVGCGAVLSLSPHKAGGLRGLGVLLGHELHRQLRPLLRGGGQELGLRPGTQSPALAVANALAIELAIAERTARAATMLRARAEFLAGIAASGVAHRVLTPLDRSLPNTAMLHFPGVEGRNLLPTLDLIGVQASHGSACSSGAAIPPRILTAIGLDEAAAHSCVRFSLGFRDEPNATREVGVRAGAIVARRQKKS